MKHRSTKEEISLLIDNELTLPQQRELFLHMAECDDCRTFFLHLSSIRSAAGRMAAGTVPEELDRAFSALAMGSQRGITRSATVTLSLRSVVYSIGAVIMMTLFIYAAGTIQEENLAQQYKQSIRVIDQQYQRTVERN
ncbi:MAG: zf-HC2 domain-containing protein [Bacteroidetes bacterium]|nr:zf-HC2 domain-containing protein [Bacteroidota bacterium]